MVSGGGGGGSKKVVGAREGAVAVWNVRLTEQHPGDAYMAVANLHTPQPNHASRIARFAIDAMKAAQATLIDEADPARGTINLRVGFHTGSVVANVVGTKNPRCEDGGGVRKERSPDSSLTRQCLAPPRLPVWRHGEHGVAHGELVRGQ